MPHGMGVISKKQYFGYECGSALDGLVMFVLFHPGSLWMSSCKVIYFLFTFT